MITFASQASVGLQNALLVEQAGRRLDDLQALGRLGELLGAGRDLAEAELLPAALRLLGEATRADAGVLRLFAPNAGAYAYRRVEAGDEDRGEESAVEGMEALLHDLAAQVETAQNLKSDPLGSCRADAGSADSRPAGERGAGRPDPGARPAAARL